MNQFSVNPNGVNMICQIGAVVIPRDVERDAYIKTFYNTGKLFVAMEGGEAYKDVAVSKHLIEHIVFPQSKLEKGSPLILLSPEKHPESLFAIGILPYPNELNGTLDEGVSLGMSAYYGNVAGTELDAKEPNYRIFVNSVKEGAGAISMLVQTPNNHVIVDMDASGNMTISTSGSNKTFAQKEITHRIVDNDNKPLSEVSLTPSKISALVYNGDEIATNITATKNSTIIESNGFSLNVDSDKKAVSAGKSGENEDSLVLGTKFDNLMSELIGVVSNMQIVTPTGNGTVDPASKAKLESIKARAKDALSKYTKVN